MIQFQYITLFILMSNKKSCPGVSARATFYFFLSSSNSIFFSALFSFNTASNNPFGTGRGLSTQYIMEIVNNAVCLNPFGTGRGLSTGNFTTGSLWIASLNPFGTGRGLSTYYSPRRRWILSLNPFGTGRGLSTVTKQWRSYRKRSLNPFGTGRGLSTRRHFL